MSLHYLLDGYNIIHQMPPLNKLEDQRQQLIQWIESRAPQGSLRNTVTVVFDGRSDVWGGGAVPSPVQIIFSREESADEKIIRMVEEAAHKKSVVVVTDDRSLQYSVRALGAKVSGVQTFLGQGAPVPVRRPESGKDISKTLEHKITSEFTKIWLPGGFSRREPPGPREEKKKGKKT
ncbi:MAG: NYN domain-containing protein [Candidatus Omnitrophica bacterium]|nr:NYN domain-containing protein [Candidatus Omnitrophota bacterium]